MGKLPGDFDWRAITPEDSPRTPLDVHADPRHRDLSTAKLAKDDPAFMFSRPLFDYSSGRAVALDRTFSLADECVLKPVALIFGSYT